jgi:phage shock protein PspC (stress-responsive transcriptional regulator)
MIGGMNGMNGSEQSKRLYRLREGRLVAGVCAGLAGYFGIDVTIVRLVFAILTLFGGTGALLYVICWAVVPEEGEGASIVEGFVNKKRGSSGF